MGIAVGQVHEIFRIAVRRAVMRDQHFRAGNTVWISDDVEVISGFKVQERCGQRNRKLDVRLSGHVDRAHPKSPEAIGGEWEFVKSRTGEETGAFETGERTATIHASGGSVTGAIQ